MKITILLNFVIILSFLSSCASSQDVVQKQDNKVKKNNHHAFSTEPIGYNIMKIFGNNISKEEITEYNNFLQNILEKEFDGKSYDFVSSDKNLSSSIKLNDSFKLVEQNSYCREYSQKLEYMYDTLSFSSVSCRSDDGLWYNLTK